MKRAIWLAAFWPLVFLPFLSDPTPSGARGATVEADTTYSDDRFVGLVPGVWNIVAGESLFVPDPDSVGAGIAYRATRVGDSFLVISYDTLVVAALDSAVVDSIWTANSIGTPYAYVVDIGTTPAEWDAVAEILGFAYMAHPVDASGWSWLTKYDSLFEYWSDYFYADFQAGAASDSTNNVYFHAYYDRALAHYSYWWRTGNEKWKRRGDSVANEIYRIYFEPNNCTISEGKAYFPEGMWIRHFSGSSVPTSIDDAAYRDCITAWADKLWDVWGDNMNTTNYDDSRSQSRAVQGVMYAYLYDTTGVYPWDSLIANHVAIDSLISMHGFKADTSGVGKMRLKQYALGMSPFQTAGNVLYTLIMYNERIETTRLDTTMAIVQGAMDTMIAYWGTENFKITGRDMYGFPYVLNPSDTAAGTNDSSIHTGLGLNMLISTPFAWYFKQTGDSTYWDWFDSLTDYGLWKQADGWQYNDGKEYNQSYWQTPLALKWLVDGDTLLHMASVSPSEVDDTLYNPGMGFSNFMGDIMYLQPTEYPETKTTYWRAYWDEVEPTNDGYDWTLVDSVINAADLRGETFAFRLMAASGSGTEVPQWLIDKGIAKGNCVGFDFEPDFTDDTFMYYMEDLIADFGARYDGDERIDFVDLGGFGTWGEWNLQGTSYSDCSTPIPDTVYLKPYVDWHVQAFQNTPLSMPMAQHTVTYYALRQGVGWRGDCFGDWDMFGPGWSHMEDEYPGFIGGDAVTDTAWRKGPVQLEVCNTITGWSNTFGYDTTVFRSTIDSALAYHASVVNLKYHDSVPDAYWPMLYDWQRKMGYRFVLEEMQYVAEPDSGSQVRLAGRWSNDGVAPVYRPYRLAYRLRDTATDAIWTQDVSSYDLRDLLPGDHMILDQFTLPDSVPRDGYFLDVTVLDIVSDSAVIVIAIDSVRTDGWHEVGDVTVQ